MASNEEIKANAKLIYAALPDARFSKGTVLALAKCLDERLTWDELPGEVKICIMKLAMALDTENEIAQLTTAPAKVPAAPAPAPAATAVSPDAVLSPSAGEVVPDQATPVEETAP